MANNVTDGLRETECFESVSSNGGMVMGDKEFVADDRQSHGRQSTLPGRRESTEENVPGSTGNRHSRARQPRFADVVEERTLIDCFRKSGRFSKSMDLEQMALVVRAERLEERANTGICDQVERQIRGCPVAKGVPDLPNPVQKIGRIRCSMMIRVHAD